MVPRRTGGGGLEEDEMREIKFRAWDKKNNEMTTYFTISSQGHVRLAVPLGMNNKDIELDVILMQYTGLKDKNGKEMYLDDLVNLKTKNNPYRVVHDDFGVPCFVSPKNYIHCIDFVQYFSEMGKSDFEIIGNIHQNPELLEK